MHEALRRYYQLASADLLRELHDSLGLREGSLANTCLLAEKLLLAIEGVTRCFSAMHALPACRTSKMTLRLPAKHYVMQQRGPRRGWQSRPQREWGAAFLSGIRSARPR